MSEKSNGVNNSDGSVSAREEKLRKRQEQLAAWKQKKLQEPQEENPDENGINGGVKVKPTEETLTKEEKLKRRRAQLEAWKQKKQQEDGAEEKLSKQQQRLQEWKKKKLQQPSEPVTIVTTPVTKKKVSSILSFKNLKKVVVEATDAPIKRKQVFGDDEDEDSFKPKFKKPTFHTERGKKEDPEEMDELDKFIELISDEPKQELPKEEAIEFGLNAEDYDEASDENSDEDSEQSKLRKLRLKIQNKEKNLEALDYTKIDFQPVRKNFYKEPLELQKLLEEQVEAIRYNLGGVKVRGNDCPKPILKWSQLGLSSTIMSIIEDKLKYEKPSSIQSQALPTIMSGRDIIGIANTGSGKTISFVLPLLRHIQDQAPLDENDGPIGLVLTPTRELALQIHKAMTHFTKRMGMEVCCCYGGSSIETQIAELKRGTEVIVGTPGRIIDLLAANSGRVTNLKRTTYLVLDEADRMFDMGFEPQVTKIFTQIRPDRQTVLFSATFPRKMELLAKKILNNPIEITVGGISVVASDIKQKVELFEVTEDMNNSIEELEKSKFKRLLEILQDYTTTKVLIFVAKQSSADELLVKLLSAKQACLAIHGGKDQIDRQYAIKEFSSSNSGVNILIATSIAARGLDVKGLDLVVNYDAPSHMEDYVHRVGRTGRAGARGTAITFISSQQERSITDLVRAMKVSKADDGDISPRLVEISDKFLDNVKAGKDKFYFGFGGRGLDNLQEIRENTRLIEQKVFDKNDESGTSTTAASKTSSSTKGGESKVEMELPDFHVIEGRAEETAGPDRCKFHSRITINDLPQKARWTVVNRDSLSRIIESTSTSITNKGQYYAPNTYKPTIKKNGQSVAAVPKLYLLIEGLTENAVREANNMIRLKMIEGLEAVARDETVAPQGKYTV